VIRQIIKLQLRRIGERLKEHHGAALTYDEAVVGTVAGRCTEVESGARNVDHILSGTLLPALSGAILQRLADGRSIGRVHVSVDGEGKFVYEVE
jgi:type VI secretion system protein VasG